MDELLYEARKEKLFFYSPYNFIRSIATDIQLSQVKEQISFRDSLKANHFLFETQVENYTYSFYYTYLMWDSEYFSIPTYKLEYVLFDCNDLKILSRSIIKFLDSLPKSYIFIDIPSEDTLLIQALGLSRFKLIETRLNYYNDHLSDFNEERFEVRVANESDKEALMKTASDMRNIYDRVHSETDPELKKADEYLATYIENSLKGYVDIVMVPNESNLPSDSFLTANYQKSDWEVYKAKISKLVLGAVSSSTNRGWYKKLISEMTYYLRDTIGSEVIHINTQSTNRAAIKSFENLHYNLGSTTHIFSFFKS